MISALPDSRTDKRHTLHKRPLKLFACPVLSILATGYLPLISTGFTATTFTLLGILISIISLAWVIRGRLQITLIQCLTALTITLQCASLYAYLFLSQRFNLAYSVLGIWILSVGFSMSVISLRFLLQWPHPIFAMARLTMREAFKLRTAMVLLILMLGLIPLLPGLLSQDATPDNKLRSFMHNALFSLEFFLIFLSLIIGAGVIHRDFINRQMHLSLTKPVSRLHYLLGRWLGSVLLTSTLLILIASAILLHMHLSQYDTSATRNDQTKIKNEILTSRRISSPELPQGDYRDNLRQQRLESLQRSNPMIWGEPGEPVAPELERSLENEIIDAWLRLEPGNYKTFEFTGLRHAKKNSDYVTFRYVPNIEKGGSEGFLHMRLLVQDKPFPYEYGTTNQGRRVARPKVFSVLNKEVTELEIPSRLIDEEGTLKIALGFTLPRQILLGRVAQSDVSFDPDTGLSLFYPQDHYALNYLRGILMLWAKILLYAALGIMIATRLSLQVAIMLCAMFYFLTENGQFILSSNEDFIRIQQTDMPRAEKGDNISLHYLSIIFNNIASGQFSIREIAASIPFTLLLFSPSEFFSPWNALREGKFIPWGLTLQAIFQMGIVGSLIALGLGSLGFRNREIGTAHKT